MRQGWHEALATIPEVVPHIPESLAARDDFARASDLDAGSPLEISDTIRRREFDGECDWAGNLLWRRPVARQHRLSDAFFDEVARVGVAKAAR